MRKTILIGIAALFIFACGIAALLAYVLVDRLVDSLPSPIRFQTIEVADGSKIAYPSHYKVLETKDRQALMREVEKSLEEPARSLAASFADKILFIAHRDDRLLLVAANDAILGEILESEREAWREAQEQLYRQAFEFTADAIRSEASEAVVVLDEMTWSEREGALGVLEIQFSYQMEHEKGTAKGTAWMGVVYFPRRIYTVLSVGDERGFRLLLESSQFAPERRKEARASPTPTRKGRPIPTPTTRRRIPTPTPAGEGESGLAFPPGWVVLTGEDVRKLLSSGDVPPEARPYLEIAQQGARAVAYDPTSPGSVIVVLRQPGAMTREQADLIRQNWESVSEALAGSMRSAMESAGWANVRVEPPELFDHRPIRGRKALLAVRFQGEGEYMEASREFWSVTLYFEDATWVVTAASTDWQDLEFVLENSEW